MKRFLQRLTFLFGFCSPALAQYVYPVTQPAYNIGIVTGVGQVGQYLSFINFYAVPSNYTFDWVVTGTAPAACTAQILGSRDHIHWVVLVPVTVNGVTVGDCTSTNASHVAFKPMLYTAVNVLTYTAGDVTTAVSFGYTQGGYR